MTISILIPVFNEARTIPVILKKVLAARMPDKFKKEIIVVNDASTDQSLALLKKYSQRIKIISHSTNQGKGGAILTGLKHAHGDYILIQDADLEYDPAYYYKLLSPLVSQPVPVIYGSRLINLKFKLFGPNRTPLPLHYFTNKFLTALTNFLYGQSISDMETGYKIINRRLMLSLRLSSKRFDIEPEISAKLLKLKIPILEIPITVKPRSYADGKKITWIDGIAAIMTLLKHYFIN